MGNTIGTGLGGFVAVAAQPTYGATFVTPTRAPSFKSFKQVSNPHPVQGGPYLRDGGLFDIGSARVLTWLDAKGTLSGDMVNTGMALLLQCGLGTAATLVQLASTTAYELGGASGTFAGAPDKTNSFLDLQAGVPTDDGTLHPFNFHSGIVTKATWVFDRSGLVTYEYELDFQYVETSTALITPTEPAAPVPFTMVNNGGSAGSTSTFKVGAFGSEAAVSGVKKCTIVLDRKMATDRIYNGSQYKKMPVTNDTTKINVSLDTDYDADAKTALFDLMLAGTPISLVCSSVGNAIATSSHNDTFQLGVSNMFADTGGDAPLAGPAIVNNTIAWSGTIDSSADPALTAVLITADTAF